MEKIFRAYVPHGHLLRERDGFAFIDDWQDTQYIGLYGFDPFESDGIIVVQSIGRSDKNGVKIYDGDLLRIEYSDGDFREHAVCWVENDYRCGWSIMPRECERAEVIGSIYSYDDNKF